MRIYMLVFVIGLTEAYEEYSVSQETSTSTDAHTLCRLATPDILYSGNTLTLDLNITNVNGTVQKNQKLWVGYAKILTAFLYIGCVAPGLLGTYTLSGKDPGQCFSTCNSKFIGMEEERCYCLSSPPQVLRNNTCDKKCATPKNTVCGHEAEGVSIYMPVNDGQHAGGYNDQTLLCLAYEPTGGGYLWELCSNRYPTLCQTGSFQASGSAELIEGYEMWDVSMRTCIERSLFPAQKRHDFHNLTNEGSPTWIGHIRSYTIVQDAAKARPGFTRGYVKFNDGVFILEFETGTGSIPALCSQDEVITVTNPIQTTSVASQATTTTIITGKSSSLAATTTHFRSTNRTHSPIQGRSDKAKGNNTTITYIIVPIIVVLTAAVIGFIVWRKRNNRHNEQAKEKENKAYNGDLPDANQSDNSSKLGTDIVKHDYLILEPQDEYAVIKDSDINYEKEGEYDTTKPIARKDSDTDTGNIYNKFASETEDTYDHANTAENKEDSTYDHTGGFGTESTYNTTETLSQSKKGPSSPTGDYDLTSPVDDTYNHLGGPVGGTAVEDTYNRAGSDMRNPAQVAQEYTYTNPLARNPAQTQDNTKANYDYTYAKAGANGSTMPVKFTFDQSQSSVGYEFAKEASATVNYELAKPTDD